MQFHEDIRVQLAKVILEVFDLISLQEHGCKCGDIPDETDRQAIMDHAQDIMQNWHECHEFAAESFANPVLLKALLQMYSDINAAYHEAQQEHVGDAMQDLPRH